MIRFFSLAAGAVLVGLLVALLAFHVELALVATLGLAVVCLAWLVAVLVLPWDLFFRARHLLAEMVRSEKRGIAVDAEARTDAAALEKRMLRISVGLHVVSALLVAAGSWFAHQRLGYAFAALFLLSTFFRPAVAYYQFLHAKLAGYLSEVKYPREDVLALLEDVKELKRTAKQHGESLEERQREEHKLEQGLRQAVEAARAGDQESQRKLDAVARKFEETIDRLTDNQEIISGIKAFLRLVQSPKAE
jgi:hypothetical protein